MIEELMYDMIFFIDMDNMNVVDERFKKNIDKYGEGTAEFVSDAIEVYCRK